MAKVITKFWGNGCPNCKAMTPFIDAVAAEYPEITFKDVNETQDAKAAEDYGVTTLPTLVFEKDGEVVGRIMGLKPKSLIIKKIQEVF